MAGGVTDERLIAAHRALRDAGDVQFTLPPVAPPEPPPAWLKTLGEWFEWLVSPLVRLLRAVTALMPDAPYARIFLWVMIVVLAAFVVRLVVIRLREGAGRWPRRRRAGVATGVEDAEAVPDWAPDAAPARRWLEQADRLAAEGRFAEAVHHLLLRSVEDIARRRPQALRPALTSRDIARSPVIPDRPRGLFADLAGVVERSLFGGRPVGPEDWGRCRSAYADFALPGGWSA